MTTAAKRKGEDAGLRARLAEVQIEVVTSAVIEQMVRSEAVHQGLLAVCAPLEGPDIGDIEPRGLGTSTGCGGSIAVARERP